MQLSQLDPEKLKVLKSIISCAEEIRIPIVLIGASARDVFLTGIHKIPPSRSTMDVDFAVRVKNWDHFNQFRKKLIEQDGFKKDEDPKHPERLISPDGKWADILPFDGIEDKNGSIFWPEDNIEMSVLGFEDAFGSAQIVKLPTDSNFLEVSVATLPGISMLKLLAWMDRQHDIQNRRKHVKDIYVIIENYSMINSKRLEKGPDSDLEELYPDALLTGARLLGRDIRKLCNKNTEAKLDDLLQEQTKSQGNCLFNQDLRKYCYGDYKRAKQLVTALYEGFKECL